MMMKGSSAVSLAFTWLGLVGKRLLDMQCLFVCYAGRRQRRKCTYRRVMLAYESGRVLLHWAPRVVSIGDARRCSEMHGIPRGATCLLEEEINNVVHSSPCQSVAFATLLTRRKRIKLITVVEFFYQGRRRCRCLCHI